MTLIFDIRPMAKQSVRFTRNGMRYQPEDVVNYHTYLRLMAQQQMVRDTPYSCPLRVQVIAQYALPKSRPKRDRLRVAGGGVIPKPTKPDCDNILKATLDPLNGVCWTDDALICEATVVKQWGDVDTLMITIEEI